MRNISQRLLLIIATTRRRLQNPHEENTGFSYQFCDEGHLFCTFNEHNTGINYRTNSQMDAFMAAFTTEYRRPNLAYADDLDIITTQMNR